MTSSGTPIDESYEVYRENPQDSYGVGFGVEEERGEAVKNVAVAAGRVLGGAGRRQHLEPLASSSVRLEPGKLTQRNLVVDTSGDAFIGFYPPGSNMASSLK